MKNYEYSLEELKIIVDVANKHKIPISIGDDSIVIQSKQDFYPLMEFSTRGLDIPIDLNSNTINYYQEIIDDLKIFMQEQVTIKS